jgi:hypothetical protein
MARSLTRRSRPWTSRRLDGQQPDPTVGSSIGWARGRQGHGTDSPFLTHLIGTTLRTGVTFAV